MNEEKWGKWSISKLVFGFICDVIDKNKGSTLLELGSGWTSGQFAEKYTVHSVEQDEDYAIGPLAQPKVNYILCPIDPKTNWYNLEKLVLPIKYDLFLIDGPRGSENRVGIMNNLKMFDPNVPWVLDDLQNKVVFDMTMDIAKYLNRPPHVYPDGTGKGFAII